MLNYETKIQQQFFNVEKNKFNAITQRQKKYNDEIQPHLSSSVKQIINFNSQSFAFQQLNS